MTQVQPAKAARSTTGRKPHLPALDGLRGVAILGVLLFHTGHLSGGFLGVDLFFALSGYLITDMLLREIEATGAVSLVAFWGSRIRRLLPVLATMLAGVAVLVWAVGSPHRRHRRLHRLGHLVDGDGQFGQLIGALGRRPCVEAVRRRSARAAVARRSTAPARSSRGRTSRTPRSAPKVFTSTPNRCTGPMPPPTSTRPVLAFFDPCSDRYCSKQ
ncbi:MAG TPA: acyltransferase [Actinoallomurus sp.]|nr:acyltransferase [Actinoallomurus sp.]